MKNQQNSEFGKVYYIKLGQKKDNWETDCIEKGYLRLGYGDAPIDSSIDFDFKAVRDHYASRGHGGAATRHAKQIEIFYKASESDVFITFFNRRLYWCRPKGSAKKISEKSHTRETISGWSANTVDIDGSNTELHQDRLSGSLTKVAMFRGTVCEVNNRDYFIRTITNRRSIENEKADLAENDFIKAVEGLIGHLDPRDFEVLVDLILIRNGWQRQSGVGGVEKIIEAVYVFPMADMSVAVQVKSQTNQNEFDRWKQDTLDLPYDRKYFFWHKGSIQHTSDDDVYDLRGPSDVAQLCVDAGLFRWVRDRV